VARDTCWRLAAWWPLPIRPAFEYDLQHRERRTSICSLDNAAGSSAGCSHKSGANCQAHAQALVRHLLPLTAQTLLSPQNILVNAPAFDTSHHQQVRRKSPVKLALGFLASWPKVLTAANQIVIKFSLRMEASGRLCHRPQPNSVASVISIKTIFGECCADTLTNCADLRGNLWAESKVFTN